jgi:hypothetical protein
MHTEQQQQVQQRAPGAYMKTKSTVKPSAGTDEQFEPINGYTPVRGEYYKTPNAGYSDEMLLDKGFEKKTRKDGTGIIWVRPCPNCVKYDANGDLRADCTPGAYQVTGRVGAIKGQVKTQKCFQCATIGKGFQTPADLRRTQNAEYFRQLLAKHNQSNIQAAFGKRPMAMAAVAGADGGQSAPMPSDEDIPF